MGKKDKRAISRKIGLPTWDNPAFAGRPSRFPHGQTITKEKLAVIDELEQILLNFGFRQVWVICQGIWLGLKKAEMSAANFLIRKLWTGSMRNSGRADSSMQHSTSRDTGRTA